MIDEHLPHLPEIEKALLTQIILSDDIGRWVDREDLFFLPEHQAIFKELATRGLRDLPSLGFRLQEQQDIVSLEFLASLYNGEANVEQGNNYYEILIDQLDRRRAILASRAIEKLAVKPSSTIDEILAEAATITKTSKKKESVSVASDLAIDFENWVNEINSGALKDDGIEWGFSGLSEIIDKLRPSELCLIGGYSGSGKTSIANSIVALSCVPSKRPSLIFSLEMSKRQEVMRLASIVGRVHLKKLITKGAMSPEDLQKFHGAIKALHDANFGIEDEVLSIEEITEKAKKYQDEHGLDLCVIDHAQLVRLKAGRGVNQYTELGNVALKAKWLAKELDCVVMLLTQLNKTDGGPYGADIMKAHSDQFLIVDESAPDAVTKFVHVVKQRNGSIGDCECEWFGPCAAFY